MSSIRRTGFEKQATKLTNLADEVLSLLLPHANQKQLEKTTDLYNAAFDMDPHSSTTLLSRAKVHCALRRFDLAYVDTSEALCLDPSAGSTPLDELSRRLVPQQSSFKVAERLRNSSKKARAGGKYAQAVQLLSNGFKVHKRVDLLVERSYIHMKCRSYDLAYVDASEAYALPGKKYQGESMEKVAKLQRDALLQLGELKHFSDPSLILTSFASILMDKSDTSAQMVSRSAPTPPGSLSVFIVADAVKVAGAGCEASPKVRFENIPVLFKRVPVGSVKDVNMVEVQFDKGRLELLRQVGSTHFKSLEWLMLDAVDLRGISLDDFKLIFSGASGGGEEKQALFNTVKAIYFNKVQVPASISPDLVLQLKAIRDASTLIFHTALGRTSNPLRFATSGILACLRDRRNGECLKLQLPDYALEESISQFVGRIRKEFTVSKSRSQFRVVVVCTWSGSADGIQPLTKCINSMMETLVITRKVGPLLCDDSSFGCVTVRRWK